jgi:hypothetical protein
MIYALAVLCVMGGFVGGWRMQVWIYSKMVRGSKLVFKSDGEWIGSAQAIEEIWKKYNADCMRRK